MTPITDDKLAELRPCPFCGAWGAELMVFCDPEEGADNSGPSRRVQCGGCNVEAPFYDTRAEAIAAWNRRAPDARLSAYEEALEPFATRADRYNEIPGLIRFDDSVELWQVSENKDMRVDISIGDLRRARTILRKEETE